MSALDQNEQRQLEGQVLDRVFTDKASGKDAERPRLVEMVGFARERDTVVVHSMDRLALHLDDLRAVVRSLTGKGVRVEFLKEGLVFTGEDSPMANLMLSVMEAFAEFERSLIRERQREGIALAKVRGAYRGCRQTLDAGRVAELVRRAAAGPLEIRAGAGDGVPVPAPARCGNSESADRILACRHRRRIGLGARHRLSLALSLTGTVSRVDQRRAVFLSWMDTAS